MDHPKLYLPGWSFAGWSWVSEFPTRQGRNCEVSSWGRLQRLELFSKTPRCGQKKSYATWRLQQSHAPGEKKKHKSLRGHVNSSCRICRISVPTLMFATNHCIPEISYGKTQIYEVWKMILNTDMACITFLLHLDMAWAVWFPQWKSFHQSETKPFHWRIYVCVYVYIYIILYIYIHIYIYMCNTYNAIYVEVDLYSRATKIWVGFYPHALSGFHGDLTGENGEMNLGISLDFWASWWLILRIVSGFYPWL